jgi:hypothetical protein
MVDLKRTIKIDGGGVPGLGREVGIAAGGKPLETCIRCGTGSLRWAGAAGTGPLLDSGERVTAL